MSEELTLTVSSTTNTIELGDSIYHKTIAGMRLSMTCAGAYATNQCNKALAYARSKLLQQGITIVWYSYFEDVPGRNDGKKISLLRTEIRLVSDGKVNV